MKSRTTNTFRKAYRQLPLDVRQAAREAYRLWQSHPYHRSLEFKQVHQKRPVYSVRVGLHWRVVGTRNGDAMVWYWIGSHAEYDNLLGRL